MLSLFNNADRIREMKEVLSQAAAHKQHGEFREALVLLESLNQPLNPLIKRSIQELQAQLGGNRGAPGIR